MHFFTRSALVWMSLAALASTAGCSSAPKKGPEEFSAKDQQIATLNGRVGELESQLKGVNDKLDAMQILFENATHLSKPTPAGVQSHKAKNAGKPVESRIAGSDPEAGFERDAAIQAYRRAYVLLEAGKTPEALLAFTEFVEKFPDHPLAGAAQYYVGKCYLEQKQYKNAIQEFNRVLTSYDRSSHVSHTLRDLAEAEEAIGATESAAKHRQLLNSLFPQSPATTTTASASTEMPTVSKQAPAQPGLDAPPAPATAPADVGADNEENPE